MSYEYKVAGQTVRLEQDNDVVAVRFEDPAPQSVRARIVNQANELGEFSERLEVPGEKFTIVPVAPTEESRPRRFSAAASAAAATPEVKRVAPVFKHQGNQILATDRIIVNFKDKASRDEILKEYGGTLIEERYGDCVIRLPEQRDPLKVASELAEDPRVEYAEPDFVVVGRHIARSAPGAALAKDPLLSKQYAMKITEAENAWAVQTGNPAIRIAILDEGVDTRHEDLKAAIVGMFDAIDNDAFQEPNPWDGHGTACAGLAAATGNNGKGIKGVGAGCSLLAVRIAFSQVAGGPWRTSNAQISRAIDWSWNEGKADVLSNSWGGGLPSNAIIKAFERATTQGRNGKGAAVIVAAGNENSEVNFPANLAGVIAVAASNEFDEPKTPTSRDGETWWGTCHGPEVAVAAPGVHNYTTDITGSGGYAKGITRQRANYTPDFNGTSSATPIVAGAVGLMLSKNPSLTPAQVRTILTSTADKVGPVPYVAGRNDFMGHGRVNVLKAVKAS